MRNNWLNFCILDAKCDAMKLLITTILLLLTFTCVSMAQELNQKTPEGLKTGQWREEDKNGTVMEGEYVAGKKNGVWTTTNAKGVCVSKVTYTAGMAQGEATFYYENGVVQEHGIWNIDHWEGEYERNYENGNPYCKFNYNRRGKREGHQIYFHENGKTMYDGTWKGGKITGTLSIYNTNGIKTAERMYDEGGKFSGAKDIDAPTAPVDGNAGFKGTGKFTLYYLDGRPDRKGDFVDGELKNGEWYIYNNQKKLIRTDIYVNGEKKGVK